MLRTKFDGARAQAPDRAWRNFYRPYTLLVDAEFSVDWAASQPHGADHTFSHAPDGGLLFARKARWHNVNRFLKERPFERVRLIENSQYFQFATRQNPFDRHFAPGNIFLYERVRKIGLA